jgi:hypothetical protein
MAAVIYLFPGVSEKVAVVFALTTLDETATPGVYTQTTTGVEGLTPLVNVYDDAGSIIVTAAATVELDNGAYYYEIDPGLITGEASLSYDFYTTSTDVDAQHVWANVVVMDTLATISQTFTASGVGVPYVDSWISADNGGVDVGVELQDQTSDVNGLVTYYAVAGFYWLHGHKDGYDDSSDLVEAT